MWILRPGDAYDLRFKSCRFKLQRRYSGCNVRHAGSVGPRVCRRLTLDCAMETVTSVFWRSGLSVAASGGNEFGVQPACETFVLHVVSSSGEEDDMSKKPDRAGLLKAVASGVAAVALATAAASGPHVTSVGPGDPGECVVVSLR